MSRFKIKSMEPMTTVSEVINQLRKDGYTIDFNLDSKINPDEFVVDKHYRFEGATDPDDEAVVYAISSLNHDLKGILVNGYGINSNPVADEMIKSLKEREL
ncbi:phosphoribosylpyrophosphate synthetase [Arcticibacter svalbardensis]|nr:phosphoribosylpyrophosphate synthetase [Arcticibacter svalbardensis]